MYIRSTFNKNMISVINNKFFHFITGELEAILKKRRERLFSSPELINLGRNSSFRPQNEAEKSTAASTASSVSTSSTTASLLRKTSSFRFGGGSMSKAILKNRSSPSGWLILNRINLDI